MGVAIGGQGGWEGSEVALGNAGRWGNCRGARWGRGSYKGCKEHKGDREQQGALGGAEEAIGSMGVEVWGGEAARRGHRSREKRGRGAAGGWQRQLHGSTGDGGYRRGKEQGECGDREGKGGRLGGQEPGARAAACGWARREGAGRGGEATGCGEGGGEPGVVGSLGGGWGWG